ncbi:MAG: hypothetical protein Q8S31_01650 [Alphaproteobacteria bacterium]|nr:hypothetical protein [Alphaproteobacteria bacterium]
MKKTLIILSAIAFFAQPGLVLAKKVVGKSSHTIDVQHYDDGTMDAVGGSHNAKGTPHDAAATLFLGDLLKKAKKGVSSLLGGGKKGKAAPTQQAAPAE